MFPALSLAIPMAPPASQQQGEPQQKPESRDELLELGFLLAVLRVLSV
jgi:hypothetical protein